MRETIRASTAVRQSGNNPQTYSSVMHVDRQWDVKQQITPGVMHHGPVTIGVHGIQISHVTAVQRDVMNHNIKTGSWLT